MRSVWEARPATRRWLVLESRVCLLSEWVDRLAEERTGPDRTRAVCRVTTEAPGKVAPRRVAQFCNIKHGIIISAYSTSPSSSTSRQWEVLRSSLRKQWNNKLSRTSSTLLCRSTSRTPQAGDTLSPRGWKGLFWRDGIKTIKLHFLGYTVFFLTGAIKLSMLSSSPSTVINPWDGSRFGFNFYKKLYWQWFIVLNFDCIFQTGSFQKGSMTHDPCQGSKEYRRNLV